MSKFTKRITKTYQFDGDEVTVTMNRLKRKDATKIAPFLPKADADGKYSMSTEASFAFMDKVGDILCKYVTSITGLKYDGGAPIEKELVLGGKIGDVDEEAEAYFMPLIGEMMSDLMTSSFIGGETTKKSDKPSNAGSVVIANTKPALSVD